MRLYERIPFDLAGAPAGVWVFVGLREFARYRIGATCRAWNLAEARLGKVMLVGHMAWPHAVGWRFAHWDGGDVAAAAARLKQLYPAEDHVLIEQAVNKVMANLPR